LASQFVQLSEIFLPDRPVDDARYLVGREKELRALMVGFESSPAGVPILVGPPGIGKTSLLHMMRQVLVGFPEVLEERQLVSVEPKNRRRFVILVRCDRDFTDEESLSKSIVENLMRAVAERPQRRAFSLRGFEVEASVPLLRGKATWERSTAGEGSWLQTLSSRLGELTEDNVVDEVVLMLDECEQLPWVERLLEFTRDFHLGETRFFLAIRDHAARRIASASNGDYRWPSWIQVNHLSFHDMEAFFHDAEGRLQALGITWSLDPEALAYIAQHSGGEPWYLHMVGHELIYDDDLRLEEAGTGSPVHVRVRLSDVRRAEQKVLRNRLYGLHGQRYLDTVKRASRREEVLRSLAIFDGSLIPSNFVSHIARRRVKSARTIVESLASGPDPVLLREHAENAWYFADHQFRVFCRLTTVVNSGADEFAKAHIDDWRLRY
jgi:hypothetical protein